MEHDYLIDTNVIIDNFGNKLPQAAKDFLYDLDITVSAVTKIEVLGWLNATKEQLNPLYAFMELATILPMDEAVIDKTVAIRQTKKIALGDAIIAATAQFYDFTIVTNNERDFNRVTGLKILKSFQNMI